MWFTRMCNVSVKSAKKKKGRGKGYKERWRRDKLQSKDASKGHKLTMSFKASSLTTLRSSM